MPPPIRKHLLSRGRLAQRANDFLGEAWDKGWLPPPDLDPEAIWALAAKPFGDNAARAETGGRAPIDVADFRERFERLAHAAADEAQLNALGRAMAWGQLSRSVKNRLALGALWHAQPELLETAIPAPIIVIGHMRSGTTRVHKLLASDPAHSHTRYQDAYHPVPSPLGMNHVKSAVELAMLGALNPWLQSIHPMKAGEVEEELAWLSAALHHSIYETQWHIPSYSAWSEARDPAPVYNEFSRLLLSDAHTRGNADKRRVLKVPAFAEDLPTLLEAFPDALIVVTERDHQSVLRSAVSLCANQMAVQSDTCDLAKIEALWEHKIALRNQCIAETLNGWKGPIARLEFQELGEDWEGAIARCYKELGLSLTPQTLENMRALMAKSAKGEHHAHSQQLKRFSKSNEAD